MMYWWVRLVEQSHVAESSRNGCCENQTAFFPGLLGLFRCLPVSGYPSRVPEICNLWLPLSPHLIWRSSHVNSLENDRLMRTYWRAQGDLNGMEVHKREHILNTELIPFTAQQKPTRHCKATIRQQKWIKRENNHPSHADYTKLYASMNETGLLSRKENMSHFIIIYFIILTTRSGKDSLPSCEFILLLELKKILLCPSILIG